MVLCRPGGRRCCSFSFFILVSLFRPLSSDVLPSFFVDSALQVCVKTLWRLETRFLAFWFLVSSLGVSHLSVVGLVFL